MAMKKIRKTLLSTSLAALAMGATAADATVYLGNRTANLDRGSSGPATASLSLTTDGTLGALAVSNVIAWSVVMTDSRGTVTLDQTNSAFLAFQSALFATATDITFDFDQQVTSCVYIQRDAPLAYYGVETRGGCTGGAFSGFGESLYTGSGGIGAYENRTGIVVIASALSPTAVPEPASWALMIAGFGLVGGAMRSRAKVTVRYA